MTRSNQYTTYTKGLVKGIMTSIVAEDYRNKRPIYQGVHTSGQTSQASQTNISQKPRGFLTTTTGNTIGLNRIEKRTPIQVETDASIVNVRSVEGGMNEDAYAFGFGKLYGESKTYVYKKKPIRIMPRTIDDL